MSYDQNQSMTQRASLWSPVWCHNDSKLRHLNQQECQIKSKCTYWQLWIFCHSHCDIQIYQWDKCWKHQNLNNENRILRRCFLNKKMHKNRHRSLFTMTTMMSQWLVSLENSSFCWNLFVSNQSTFWIKLGLRKPRHRKLRFLFRRKMRLHLGSQA